MGILKETILALTLGLIAPHSIASQAEIQTAGPKGPLRGTLTTAQNPSSVTALIVAVRQDRIHYDEDIQLLDPAEVARFVPKS